MTDQTQSSFYGRLLSTVIVVVGALLLWYTLHIVLLIFMGAIFGVFLRKTGEWIHQQTGLSINWSIVAVICILLLVAVVAIWIMTPKILSQARELTDQLPNSWRAFQEMFSRNELGNWIIQNLPPMQEVAGSLGSMVRRATTWLYTFFGALTGILIIAVIGLYLAFGAELSTQGIVKLVPPHKRDRARSILHALSLTLYWWLIGRLASMGIIGIFSFIGLWALGMPLAFTLGLFAAVMSFIPNIGPILSIIPALLLALQMGLAQAGYVILLFMALQTVESYILTPLIQRKVIAMPPALILSAQLIMGVVQGILGVLVATPLVAAIIVLIKFMYIEDVLGDQDIEIQAKSH